jgi:hypothetical protein
MKMPAFAIAILLVAIQSAFGKGEFQLHGVTVHDVTVSPAEITFIVSGPCSAIIRKEGAEAATLDAFLDHAQLTVRMPTSWDEHTYKAVMDAWKKAQDEALLLKGKKAWLDAGVVQYVVDNMRIKYITCANAQFGEQKQ